MNQGRVHPVIFPGEYEKVKKILILFKDFLIIKCSKKNK